jgi:hypothetical protein
MVRIGKLFAARFGASVIHLPMLEGAGESSPLARLLPVRNGSSCEEMEKGILRCRDCPSQACLSRPLLIEIGKELRLLEQMIREWHLLGPRRLLKFGLFRLAAEIEVGMKACLVSLGLIHDLEGYLLGFWATSRRFSGLLALFVRIILKNTEGFPIQSLPIS